MSFSASSRAEEKEIDAMNSRMAGIAYAFMLNREYPSPTRRTVKKGLEAISPQMRTDFPRTRETSAMRRKLWRMEGWRGWNRWDTSGLTRSTASVYWTRSFVPTQRKSTSLDKSSRITTAEGTSIMAPTGTSAVSGTEARSKRSRTCWMTSLACQISSTDEIMGSA